MQLKELVEQEGLDKVALKTTISQINLKYMVDEDFEKLSRVKALGFIQILKREYKELNLSELKEKIEFYFEDHKPDHDNVIVVSEVSSTDSGFSFFKWFVILGILFGGWYLYNQGKLEGIMQNINSKKDIYGDDKALENNITIEEAEQISVSKNAEEPIAIVAPSEPKIDLKKEVAKEVVVAEVNKSTEVATTTQSKTMQSAIVQELAKMEDKQSVVAAEVEQHPTTESTKTAETVSGISTITINPTRGMLWFGFINVDTKKKKEFMKNASTPFDIDDGRWILVTGHGFVDIASELTTLEVSDRNKHYFYIDSTELKEISQKEFRTLNGGHGWI